MPRKGKRSQASKLRWQKFGESQHSTPATDSEFASSQQQRTVTGEGDHLNLSDRLQCLSSGVRYALLIMSSVCIALFQDQQGRYGFFDPHSRRPDGLPHCPDGNGTAVMLIFTHLRDLIRKIVTSFRMLGASPYAPYELTPVLFQSLDELSTDENIALIDTNADIGVSHMSDQDRDTVSSVIQAEKDMTFPSLSVTESTPCADITLNANEFMHHNSGEGAVECPRSDTTTRDDHHMPNIDSKRTKKKEAKFKRRVRLLEKRKVTPGKIAEKIKRLKNIKEREKYANDKFYKNLKKSQESKSYSRNVEYTNRKMSNITTNYQQNPNFRHRQKFYSTNRYSKDIGFKQWKRLYINNRYANDPAFRSKQKETIRQLIGNKYRNNIAFRSKQKETMRQLIGNKYRNNIITVTKTKGMKG
ncbi:uncharacterized protein LOC120571766 [Perca fluviatilis]|uniref:uncharacterized protein LOC120571766 n=1 Tax=Perca fluviatilis TaxID=8168 RepID=UPI0019650817|nr:uncharacterized protein LOC120571766 [Perca fluviatilis]